jgi:Protein of unknown function (DUF2510)
MQANWHPDPTQRHELRFWDGVMWTQHVSDRGVTSVDPMPSPPSLSSLSSLPSSLAEAASDDSGADTAGADLSELRQLATAQSESSTGSGALMYALLQGWSSERVTKQVVMKMGDDDASIEVKWPKRHDPTDVEVKHVSGAILFRLVRQASGPTVFVVTAANQEIGRIDPQFVAGGPLLVLSSLGQPVGSVFPDVKDRENLKIFNVLGVEAVEIAQASKLVAIEFTGEVSEPLHTLTLATALASQTFFRLQQFW